MDRVKDFIADLNAARRRVFRLNFYRCHMAYFVFTIVLCSVILYGSNTGPVGQEEYYGMAYIDAIFLAASAMTTTGLNTFDLNAMNGYQRSVVFILMLLGDLSTVSISVVILRRCMFRGQLLKEIRSVTAAKKVLGPFDEEQALGRHEHLRPRLQPRLRHARSTTRKHDARDVDVAEPSDNTFHLDDDDSHQRHLGVDASEGPHSLTPPLPVLLAALETSSPTPPFALLFELLSAYGNTGLSLGGFLRTPSKLVLVALMLRGRHRILPLAIDRSVLVPGTDIMRRLDREGEMEMEMEMGEEPVGGVREVERGGSESELRGPSEFRSVV
ncbi:hypothetical protein F5Y15DRAFT_414048 [Xylariaceae sp. FL0016]|nr:hypothetical protein F5Y15DRAFT_414048 [Xylariaceae sp. FL0016]